MAHSHRPAIIHANLGSIVAAIGETVMSSLRGIIKWLFNSEALFYISFW